MGQWAKEAFNRLKQHEGSEHEENQRRALERQQVLADSPYRWHELFSAIDEQVRDFSTMRPGFLRHPDFEFLDNSFELSTSIRDLSVVFDPASPRISYEVLEQRGPSDPKAKIVAGTYSLGLKNGQVWFFEKGTPYAVPDVKMKLQSFLI